MRHYIQHHKSLEENQTKKYSADTIQRPKK
jgi:hypothetical protein